MLTPLEKASKWKLGVEGSVDRSIASVNGLTVSPATQAIAAKATMRANWLASVDDGIWEAKLQPFTNISTWRPLMLAGLEKNRTISAADEAKLQGHYSLQDHMVTLIDGAVASINAGTFGVTDIPAFNDTMLKIICNVVFNKHIKAFNTGTTLTEAAVVVVPSLVSDFGFVAT